MNTRSRFISIFSFLLLTLLIGAGALMVRAETAEELNKKIADRNNDIALLEKEIASYQAQLTDLGKQKNTLTNSIKQLDISAKKLALDLQVTQSKINATNLKIQSLSLDIGTTGESIDTNKVAIGHIIQARDEMDHLSLIESLADDVTLTNAWRQVDAILRLEESLGTQVSSLKKTKSDLEAKKQEVENAEKELEGLKNQLNDQKKVVDQNTRDKQKLLKDTKNLESNYAAQLKDKLAKKTAFEKELQSFESQLKFILDPTSFPAAGSHVLSWPVDTVRITQFFGKTVAAARLYVSGTHSGVDFGVPIGTPVRAVSTGTVTGTGNTDLTCPGASYGNWVFIKYDNGLATTYGHMSVISTASGTRVKSGDIVGYSGSTGYSTGPHLHVSVFVASGVSVQTFPSQSCGGKVYTMPVAARNAYLDPMQYFPVYTGPTTVGSQTD